MFRSCRFHEIYRYIRLGINAVTDGQLYIEQSCRRLTVQFYERYTARGIDYPDCFRSGYHDERSGQSC